VAVGVCGFMLGLDFKVLENLIMAHMVYYVVSLFIS
jgi:hypothetical protein